MPGRNIAVVVLSDDLHVTTTHMHLKVDLMDLEGEDLEKARDELAAVVVKSIVMFMLTHDEPPSSVVIVFHELGTVVIGKGAVVNSDGKNEKFRKFGQMLLDKIIELLERAKEVLQFAFGPAGDYRHN